MKKFLVCTLTALLVLTFGISVVAANDYGYEEVGDWYVGKGFPVDGTDGEISKPVVSEGQNGLVNVGTGGWYTDGSSWGGIASKDLYMLDGLTVELQFSNREEAGDRWINIGFFEKPDIFKVGDIPSNRGYGNLIRPSNDDNEAIYWQHIEAVQAFSPVGQDVAVPFTDDVKLVMEVKKTEAGNWKFILNGNESAEYTNFDDVFKGDRAYIVIASSGQNAIDPDSYAYTVKVTGQKAAPLTEAEIAEWDAAVEEKRAAAEAALKEKLEQEAAEREARLKAQEEAEKEQEEAIEDSDEEVVDEQEDAEAEQGEDVVAEDEDNGNLITIIIIIVVVIIIIAAIAIIAGKKKK